MMTRPYSKMANMKSKQAPITMAVSTTVTPLRRLISLPVRDGLNMIPSLRRFPWVGESRTRWRIDGRGIRLIFHRIPDGLHRQFAGAVRCQVDGTPGDIIAGNGNDDLELIHPGGVAHVGAGIGEILNSDRDVLRRQTRILQVVDHYLLDGVVVDQPGRSLPASLPGSVVQKLVDLDEPANLPQSQEQDQNERQEKAELHRSSAAAAAYLPIQ